jgi:hypothetical protein
MKAQISFEFYFALFIFVVFITFVAFQVVASSPNYLNQLQAQNIRLNVFRVSELLINDNGDPINWQSSSVNRFGLSDETQNMTNMLSTSKITVFASLCSSKYDQVKQLLDIGSNMQMIVNIVDISTNTKLVTCIPPQTISKSTPTVTITRIVAFNDGTYGNVTVTLW